MSRKRRFSSRFRVGKVSVYVHHGAWWVYYRDGGLAQRHRVGSLDEAKQVAAQVNAQLVSGAPRLLTFESIGLPQLRRLFLEYHELVLNSSVSTVQRYRAATKHLENYALAQSNPPQAHEVKPAVFTAYLRQIEVAPNGHQNTGKRKLRGKGIQFILATCRSMYTFACKRRHLPPYAGNPFSDLPLDRMKIDDAKPIFVFEPATELAFFKAASNWAFPIHFTLAKTGLRVGELVHLLIEDVDLERGWLHVRNKTDLGWRVKTGHDRPVPLPRRYKK
jgi:integrase